MSGVRPVRTTMQVPIPAFWTEVFPALMDEVPWTSTTVGGQHSVAMFICVGSVSVRPPMRPDFLCGALRGLPLKCGKCGMV